MVSQLIKQQQLTPVPQHLVLNGFIEVRYQFLKPGPTQARTSPVNQFQAHERSNLNNYINPVSALTISASPESPFNMSNPDTDDDLFV